MLAISKEVLTMQCFPELQSVFSKLIRSRFLSPPPRVILQLGPPDSGSVVYRTKTWGLRNREKRNAVLLISPFEDNIFVTVTTTLDNGKNVAFCDNGSPTRG